MTKFSCIVLFAIENGSSKCADAPARRAERLIRRRPERFDLPERGVLRCSPIPPRFRSGAGIGVAFEICAGVPAGFGVFSHQFLTLPRSDAIWLTFSFCKFPDEWPLEPTQHWPNTGYSFVYVPLEDLSPGEVLSGMLENGASSATSKAYVWLLKYGNRQML
ncbi:hypothetical protein Taro_000242 [Colocasia esculenta]|uniref:Uncharacterized protein n=1 Tax=Colocasia esculenta TaxID=4460 RepID=A0A843TCL2_COLES|nr:hypothetical protein [Colocasia esculenta]